jgi:LDH2 family malate/lactate/ureidoglycolate dehydrogenase
VGAACAGVGDPGKNWGHLVLAIDPDLFGDREAFINNVSTLVEKVKGTKRLPGVEEIFLPGERGNRQAAQIRASGTIDLEDNLLEELRKAAG